MKHKVALLAVAGLVAIGTAAYFAPQWQAALRGTGDVAPLPADGGKQDKGAARGPGAGGGAGAPGAPAPVEVFEVRASRVQEDLAAVGSLRSNESVVLRPEVAGRISKIGFRDGQVVKRGQLIVALDASVNQAEVLQARAEYDLALSNLKRVEDLASKNFVSPSAKDQAASNVQVSEAKLKLAEARLSKMDIVAPFDGMVGIRNVSVGDYVKDGTDLVNIEEINTLKADFRVPERYFAALHTGQKAEVTADALPGERFPATLDAINPRVDASGRSLELRARLANPSGRLRPGMFVRVRLILGERPEALMLPEEAIVPSGAEFFVFRVTDGKASRVQVRTGLRRDGKVEVVSGLVAGDRVVVSGQQRLGREGQPVRIGGAKAEARDAAAGGTPGKGPAS